MTLLNFDQSDNQIKTTRFNNPLKTILGIGMLTGLVALGSTLAANINLNTSAAVEFGQGVMQTTACDSEILVTPQSTFVNSTGGGDFRFNSIAISGISSNCSGSDFTINAFGETSSAALPLFNSTSTSAVVYNNSGTYELGIGTLTGASITSGTETFTVTFTTPVAASGSIYKVTVQSGAHTVIVLPTCAQGGTCNIGDIGPGGGNIFYYRASGFNCGSDFTNIGSPDGGLCHYLEAAPVSWGGGSIDIKRQWTTSDYHAVDVSNSYGITNDATPNNTSATIGLGYKNSIALVTQNGAGTTYAAGAARAYTGGGKSDWYLPSSSELNQMCKWQRGRPWTSDTTVCSGGSPNTGTGAAGFTPVQAIYLSSSEANNGEAMAQYFVGNYQGSWPKYSVDYFRPIRAF